MGPSISFACPALTLEARSYRGGHSAFVALDPDDRDEIIAIVRQDREPGEEQAEYAAIVQDSWQDQGIGIALTRLLIDVAWDNGVRYFYTMVIK